MQSSSNEPQIKQHTEIVRLHKTTQPLRRWSIDPRFKSTLVVVTVKNLSEEGQAATLKFQHSNGSPADDHQCTIAIPLGSTPPGSDFGDDVIKFTETFGGFNSTFSDVGSGGVTSLVPGGEKTITFTTTKGYLQLVTTVANNAKVMLFIKSMNTLTATESDYPRTDTAPA
jgi:hypothetical protein